MLRVPPTEITTLRWETQVPMSVLPFCIIGYLLFQYAELPPLVSFLVAPGLIAIIWIGTASLLRYWREPRVLHQLLHGQEALACTDEQATVTREPTINDSPVNGRYYVLCDIQAFVIAGWIAVIFITIVSRIFQSMPPAVSETLLMRLVMLVVAVGSICTAIATAYVRRKYYEINGDVLRFVNRQWLGGIRTTWISLSRANCDVDLKHSRLSFNMGQNTIVVPLLWIERPLCFVEDILRRRVGMGEDRT